MPNDSDIEPQLHNPGIAQSGPQGYVLGPSGGEHLIHFRDGGNIFIKADRSTAGLGCPATMSGSRHTFVQVV